MFKPASMTRWYHPPALLAIAARATVSGLFGEFADRREAMAASRKIEPEALDPAYRYQVAEGESFWFDFMADTGDGWNPTYAIARLLADPGLKPAQASGEPTSEVLPIGRLLVMGGDEVYPTASRDDYKRKLIKPLETAAEMSGALTPTTYDLYAIPGNHDWYDGLTSFLGVFCARRLPGAFNQPHKGRDIGGRRTQQTRSYFALELPCGWWLWGIDIQLGGYVDQPQVDFFDHVAREWMPKGSKLIIATGQPEWAYVGVDPEHWKTFRNFSYLESLATLTGREHQVRLVLSGDSHHYARYTEGDRQYIVAGGGGAFLHPTHQLPKTNTFSYEFPPPGVPATSGRRSYQRSFTLQETFPSQAKSSRIAWKNVFFAFFNPDYWLTLGCACALFAWLLNANALAQGTDLVSMLRAGGAGNWWAALCAYFNLVFASPWPSLLGLAAAGGYAAFAKPYGRYGGLVRALAGFAHAAVEILIVVFATIALAWYLPWVEQCMPWMILAVGIVGGLLAATVMGIYLLISLNGFKLHWNEGFSSMRIQGYKNFLRLKIDASGELWVYPIGLERTPKDSGAKPTNPALAPRFIEKPFKV
jgi:hypothetical protein